MLKLRTILCSFDKIYWWWNAEPGNYSPICIIRKWRLQSFLSLICKRSCRIVRLHHTICHFHSTPIMAFPICPIFFLSLSFNNYCAEVAKMFHYEPLEHLTFPVGWRWLINHSTWAISEGFNSYNSLLTIAAIGRTQHTDRKKSALIRVRRIVLFERILKELGG